MKQSKEAPKGKPLTIKKLLELLIDAKPNAIVYMETVSGTKQVRGIIKDLKSVVLVLE